MDPFALVHYVDDTAWEPGLPNPAACDNKGVGLVGGVKINLPDQTSAVPRLLTLHLRAKHFAAKAEEVFVLNPKGYLVDHRAIVVSRLLPHKDGN
ncbi:hypothetical protein KCU61_g157, partial [Aureobasidium melanogenum]